MHTYALDIYICYICHSKILNKMCLASESSKCQMTLSPLQYTITFISLQNKIMKMELSKPE